MVYVTTAVQALPFYNSRPPDPSLSPGSRRGSSFSVLNRHGQRRSPPHSPRTEDMAEIIFRRPQRL
jgi:hypothetical protein